MPKKHIGKELLSQYKKFAKENNKLLINPVKFKKGQYTNKDIEKLEEANHDLKIYQNVPFKTIRKNPKETQKAYLKRLNKIKSALGQEDTPFKGVFMKTPDFAKVRFIYNKSEDTYHIISTVLGKGETLKEEYIPFDKYELLEEPHDYIHSLLDRKKFDWICPMHSAWRGKALKTGKEDCFETIDDFIERIEEWQQNGLPGGSDINNTHVLTGCLLVTFG